ncbi:PucR family transcriptional regulator [Luteipulveratus flavus]|uniref:Helix-turn-helix domain-containing protein n=1 Tax=Luteipulveratus flavus TaxID=3031728 RepID=A0ABT6CAQ3_9MICO|nr:helix-turn-helix domain-containing protein [Luteipulveratus sp. YIM 133296]MDF8265970.1 helix-turn-helix domain-containing protein [Luteipulveratus sp. YIM 133296]
MTIRSTASDDAPPWAGLPAEVSQAIRPHLGEIVEQIIGAIQRDVPAYARPLEGDFGLAVRQGVEVALSRLLLELPGQEEAALTRAGRLVYQHLGRGEARTGRPLEALLAAYRIGARVAFRTTSQVAVDEGLDPTVLLPLGESIFVYVDELSATSVEAFADEQFRQVGERDRRRGALLELMMSGRADEAEVRAQAASAEWVMPSEVVAVVVPLDDADGLRLVFGERALVRARAEYAVAVLKAPVGQRGRAEVTRLIGSRRAWVGPVRPWSRAADSLRAALAGLAVEEGHGTRALGARWVEDHLAALVLAADPDLVGDLARVRLAPLDSLRDTQRQRLVETLFSWLRHQGERARVAEELHVHPQTVGYRVGQLREVFGPALEDPQSRFELEMVLRAGHR